MGKNNPKALFNWSLTFTKRVILLITACWIAMTIYSSIMITVAIFTIGNFSYLDTFITEINSSFATIVGINVVVKGAENIFRYNEKLGGRSTHPDDIIDEELNNEELNNEEEIVEDDEES